MRLSTPFIKLPLRFDVARLRSEIEQFPETEWRAHPQGFLGNSALILISVAGGDNDDTAGEMAPAPRLAQCPYLRQVLASFHAVIGRTRLMRLSAGAEVKPHADIEYYWRERVRIHVPIVTDPGVRFNCDGTEIHMGAGEAWIFDNWRPHRVINNSGITRIHLVIDTVGSAAFWHLVSRGGVPGTSQPTHAELVTFDSSPAVKSLTVERVNTSQVASPATVKAVVHDLLADLRSTGTRNAQSLGLENILFDLANEWQALWAVHGEAVSGYAHYARLLQNTLRTAGQQCGETVLPSNGLRAGLILQSYLPPLFGAFQEFLHTLPIPRFSRPLIIVAAPRSGSTLLFEMLSKHPDLWSLADESHAEIENVPGLAPRERGYASNALAAADLTSERRDALLRNFTLQLANGSGDAFLAFAEIQRPDTVRFMEKTPKNSLRIPFFDALFPDAHYLFLYREVAANLGSMLDAWQSGSFVTYPDLPDWPDRPWSLLLIPGWRQLRNKPLAEIVARQWQRANETILENLASLPASRWRVLDYETLVKEPGNVFARVCAWLGLPAQPDREKALSSSLPYSRYTLSPPARDKWRRHESQLSPVLPGTDTLMQRLKQLGNRL